MITSGILVTMFTQEFGFSLTEIGILLTIEMVAITLTSIPAGKALDKYSNRNGIIVALVLTVILFSGYALTSDYRTLMLLQVVKGVTIGLWDTSIMLYQNKIVSEGERGKTIGNINSIKGLVSIPAPFKGALLFGYIGFNGVFATSACVLGLALLASTRLVEPKL